MNVKLRKVGNSKTLTVPATIKTVSEEYTVKNVGKSILFVPIVKHKNIFGTTEWQNYDYQGDMKKDRELQEVKSVGREIIK